MQLLEENIGGKLPNIGLSNGFLVITLKAQSWASLVAQMVTKLPASADLGLIPGSGRSSGGGHGNPLQYSCLEKPMDRGVWRATVHGVTKNQTLLSN